MAYRYESNPDTKQQELVIDGWEDGIAASPYEGITSMKNLNIRYLPGAVYSNYARIINTVATTIGIPKYWTQDPTTGNYYLIDSMGQVWTTSDPSSVAWTLLAGNSAHLGGGQGLCVYKNYLFVFKDSSIDYYNISGASWVFDWKTGLQSGVNHMAIWGQDDIMYFCNGAPVSSAGSTIGAISKVNSYKQITLTTAPAVGATSGTLTTNWTGTTGNYEISFSDGEITLALLTNGSTGITWQNPLVATTVTTAIVVTTLNVFDPSTSATYSYNNSALLLPGFEQSATWLSELKTDLIIAAGKRLYPWDRTSVSFNAVAVFIKENILKVINILNVLYVTAGVKGNIYISNGYSISPWVKIPDSFFGVIDPTLLFGDMMFHRNKLYIGVSLLNSPFTNGVFSVDLQSKTINFENQNSYGLTASGATSPFGQPNVLIELEPASIDSYASAWYDGTKGGMDKNNSTVYTNYETIIESDLIPVGTFLTPKTYLNIEFKIDKTSTGTIRISGRGNLTDSYTVLGTSDGTTISNIFNPLVIQKLQWLQIKIEIATPNTSNFFRLREVRIK